MLTAEAVETAVGKAPSGRAQIVFFRSAKSPGSAVSVREAAGGEPLILLDAGMYFIATALPGAHSYATADTGPFPLDVEPGRTYYVQADPQQERGDAVVAFQRGQVRARGQPLTQRRF
jgi:hypothetical protein